MDSGFVLPSGVCARRETGDVNVLSLSCCVSNGLRSRVATPVSVLLRFGNSKTQATRAAEECRLRIWRFRHVRMKWKSVLTSPIESFKPGSLNTFPGTLRRADEQIYFEHFFFSRVLPVTCSMSNFETEVNLPSSEVLGAQDETITEEPEDPDWMTVLEPDVRKPASKSLRYTIRQAKPEDMIDIRQSISRERLNPFFLSHKNFIVAMNDDDASIIGFGQVKQLPNPVVEEGGFLYTDSVQELSTVIVDPEYRHKGVGRAIIAKLAEGPPAPRPLYCITDANSVGLYERSAGFTVSSENSAPLILRVEVALMRLLTFALGGKAPDGRPLKLVLLELPEELDEEPVLTSYVKKKYRSGWR